jgi:putative transposase
MTPISYRRHRFPPVVIQHAVWLYLRFTLSYRDVEELLAESGLDLSYESVRSWVLKFGPPIARRLRRCRPRPSDRWHLDEMVVRIAGKHRYLWRAVDHEGEVLEILVQHRRDRSAAVKLMRGRGHPGMLSRSNRNGGRDHRGFASATNRYITALLR